jgi:phosphoglycolate phosphatase
LGLTPFFIAVGGGDSYPVRKPDPAHLLATLADAGGVAGRAVMVGDHHNDILAAHGAGIASVWARWGYGEAVTGADAEAAAFAELPAILEILVGA